MDNSDTQPHEKSITGWTKQVFMCVSRIYVDFADDIGNKLSIVGTGFWMETPKSKWFVTNKHVVDATLKKGPDTKLAPTLVKIDLREHNEAGHFTNHTLPVKFDHAKSLLVHASADVAAIRWPGGEIPNYGFRTMPTELLADQHFASDSLQPMDAASFVGFPQKGAFGWYDEKFSFPIARSASIASLPMIPFEHKSIKTSHAVLVSGLSFAGSSGSPLLLHVKGIAPVTVGPLFTLSDPNYVPPKVIGIMSGHWWDESVEADSLFSHSGLSYYTSADAILDLLKSK